MLRSIAVATFLMLSCAACSGDGGAEPPTNPTPTSTSSTSTSPSPTVPAYLESYTPDERAAYQDGLAAYQEFVTDDNRFLAAGKTTREASDFYHRYAIDWSTNWGNLAQLANNNVKVTGAAVVKWTRPVSIKLGDSPSVLVVRQCLDQSPLVVTQNGKELEQPQFERPHVFKVRLVKRVGESWWRAGIAQRGATC